jgi:hypothetical protein
MLVNHNNSYKHPNHKFFMTDKNNIEVNLEDKVFSINGEQFPVDLEGIYQVEAKLGRSISPRGIIWAKFVFRAKGGDGFKALGPKMDSFGCIKDQYSDLMITGGSSPERRKFGEFEVNLYGPRSNYRVVVG